MQLEVRDLAVDYGKVSALRNVSITVPQGKIITIIGSNGAGKSTTLKAISGMVAIKSGEISFAGKRTDGLEAEKLVSHGLVHVPEGRRVFPDMTVEENLRIGAYLRSDKVAVENDFKDVFARFPRLEERRSQRAKTMSGGEQQMLAIGRALMASPKMLLMDEPSMGLAPVLVDEIARIIKEINDRGISVVLVEQNAEMALELADYAYVLESGSISMEGPAEELHGNEHIRTAYLGI